MQVASGIRRHLHGRRLVRREGASYLIATGRACAGMARRFLDN
jgi:hypothetical protein